MAAETYGLSPDELRAAGTFEWPLSECLHHLGRRFSATADREWARRELRREIIRLQRVEMAYSKLRHAIAETGSQPELWWVGGDREGA